MKRQYDTTIAEHYKVVAEAQGLSPLSTMGDEITRALETESIRQFVEQSSASGPLTILEVGCGNGYTLEQLSTQFPQHQYIGVEMSDDLRALAESRFEGNDRVKIQKGDIRDKDFAQGITADLLICQRVIINLLDLNDQKDALNNITASVKTGGGLLFIESFDTPLARLNEARSEFDLPPIPPAHHNLYLQDDFFQVAQLKPLNEDGALTPPNFLSTHYYITRVLHAILTPADKPFKRNSEFVKFFTKAMNPNSGDYSSLKLYIFEKV